MVYFDFILYLNIKIAEVNITIVYAVRMISGKPKSSNALPIPLSVFCIRSVAFLKGRHFIKVIMPLPKPSCGNHIPLNTDCPAITTEATPPMDFSLHIEPSHMPRLIKSKEVMTESKMPHIIVTLNMLVSIIPPTKKKVID